MSENAAPIVKEEFTFNQADLSQKGQVLNQGTTVMRHDEKDEFRRVDAGQQVLTH